jgi:hypothetical protein
MKDLLCILVSYFMIRPGAADPETPLTGGLSYGAIFSIIDGTNCSPKAYSREKVQLLTS